MEAGKLRHPISIQQDAGNTKDAAGHRIANWTEISGGAVWASVEPLTGRELYMAMQVQAQVTHKIKIRYVSGVTPKMRVVYGSRNFNIESVLNIEERNIEMHLMCKENV